MELLRKETGIIELTVRGGNIKSGKGSQAPSVHTDYDYGLIVDPILNKPAFTLCAVTRIAFSPEDFILYRSFAVFILETPSENEVVTGEDLWFIALDGRESMNLLLQDKLKYMDNPSGISLASLNYQLEISTLTQLALAAFRLN